MTTNSGGDDLKWKVSFNSNISAYGTFSADDQGKGNSRADPVIITVSNLGTDATLDHFLFLSDGNDLQAYFVAHVAGFNNQPTSHFVGVSESSVVPAPPGMVLALTGIVGLGFVGLLRRRQATLVPQGA